MAAASTPRPTKRARVAEEPPRPTPAPAYHPRVVAAHALVQQLHLLRLPLLLSCNGALREFDVREPDLVATFFGPLDAVPHQQRTYSLFLLQAEKRPHLEIGVDQRGESWRWHVVCNSASMIHNARVLRQRVHAAHAAHALLAPPERRDPRYPRRSLPRDLVEYVLSFLSPSPRALTRLLLPVLY